MIVEEDGGGEISAVKIGVDGQAIQKTARSIKGVPLVRILNPLPENIHGLIPTPKVAEGTKAKKKRAGRTNVKANIMDQAHKYDVTTELSNALYGLTFDKSVRGDPMNSNKELRRLFTARSGKKVKVLAAESSTGYHVLKIAEIKVYGNESYTSSSTLEPFQTSYTSRSPSVLWS